MRGADRRMNGCKENGWDYNFNDIKSIPYPDTREYVAKVMQDRDKYYLLYKDKIK